jgi:mannose-6-phosphate isomerase-like protein (cupin superfamily)
MQQLRPGDSILARQGAAAFAAGPMPTAQQQQQQQQEQQQGAPPAWSGQLLSWLHQLTGNGDRRQQDSGAAPAGSSSSSSSARLVVLQLLLPSELLTGQLLAHHAGHYQAVAQHLPWAGAQEQQQQQQDSPSLVRDAAIARSIDEEEVCGFLADVAGAAAATPGHQQADGEQQQGAVQQQAVQQQEAHQHQQEQHDPQPTAPFASTRILKRARLSEVNAFRLPQQTNRLALLFGPTSSNPVAGTPALSLSFGVEVFEPSHVTPLHVHTTAHELFFVLAGRGEAVFGGGSSGGSDEDGQVAQQQRVRLTAGDVAVFAPGLRHGIDNANDADQLWCIQLMLPNEAFVEWVSGGELAGGIDLELAAAAASCG